MIPSSHSPIMMLNVTFAWQSASKKYLGASVQLMVRISLLVSEDLFQLLENRVGIYCNQFNPCLLVIFLSQCRGYLGSYDFTRQFNFWTQPNFPIPPPLLFQGEFDYRHQNLYLSDIKFYPLNHRYNYTYDLAGKWSWNYANYLLFNNFQQA